MNVQRPVTALSLRLPTADGRLETFDMSVPRDFPKRVTGPLNRVALAAAHMVVDPGLAPSVRPGMTRGGC